MHKEVIAFNQLQRTGDYDFRAGDVVRVHRKIVEGSKERTQVFEGMVIVMRGGQSSSPMMTVRKVSNGVGVEIIVPIYSPQITKIELVKRAKVRRANIGFVRTKPAKKLRFTFTDAAAVIAKRKARAAASEQASAQDSVSADVQQDAAPDDLTKIEGIGPKIAQTLAAAGIATFADLAQKTPEEIAEVIADVRGNHDPATWPRQAKMAADGAWDELKKWQDELLGGKEREEER